MGYADFIGGNNTSSVSEPIETKQKSLYDDFISKRQDRSKPDLSKLLGDIEVQDLESRGFGFEKSLLAGLSRDKREQARILSKQTGIPLNRFIIDPESGDLAYKAEDEQYYKAFPSGINTEMIGYYAPDVAQLGVEIGAGIPATAYGGPVTGTAAMTAVGGATEGFRQYLAKQAGASGYDPTDIVVSGVGSGAGEAVGQTAKYLFRNRLPKDVVKNISKDDLAQMMKYANLSDAEKKALSKTDLQNLKYLSEKLDVPLTIPELLDDRAFSTLQKYLSETSSSSSLFDKFYKARAKKSQAAVEKYIKNLSKKMTPEDITQAGLNIKGVAKQQLDELINFRRLETENLYDDAIDSFTGKVEAKNTLGLVENLKKGAKGDSAAQTTNFGRLDKIQKLLTKSKEVVDKKGVKKIIRVPETNIRKLHDVKKYINTLIDTDVDVLADQTIRGELIKISDQLVKDIGQKSPTYLDANARFKELSAPIQKYQESILGRSMQQVPNKNAANLVTELFTDPVNVKYAKEQIEQVDPEAWRKVTAAFIAKNLEKASKTVKKTRIDGKVVEVPDVDIGGNLYKELFGNETKKSLMRNALDSKSYEALDDLMYVLQASSRVAKGGSDTAIKQEIKTSIGENIGQVAPRLAGIDMTRPFTLLFKDRSQEAISKNSEKFAKIITDPRFQEQLKILRKQRSDVIYGSFIASDVGQFLLSDYLLRGSKPYEEKEFSLQQLGSQQ
jgi:hypothetical protein